MEIALDKLFYDFCAALAAGLGLALAPCTGMRS